ncbi:TEL2-interacting protein 1 [Paramyrothecium foliicola]|nr:TEL2-interacting protein 1 [Paramyrothecium foliicola]
MEAQSLDERNRLFHSLKPCCVKISQWAIREANLSVAARELLPLVRQVLEILDTQIQCNPAVLDEKLAEYVFFPLFYIFRQVNQYPTILVENSIRCLNILIVHGWKSRISPKLVHQILSLLTFILDDEPGSASKRDISEELALEGYRALSALFMTAATSVEAAAGLADSETIPALGHGITIILGGIVDGPTSEVQQEALSALGHLYKAIKDQGALASFLPGTISSLTKVLTTSARYKSRVLAKCLDNVSFVLTKVLSDLRARNILLQSDGALNKADVADAPREEEKLLSPAWLKATTAQVRLALARIMRLRTHDSSEVRRSLYRLCITLLDECHTTLSACADFLIETAIMLDSNHSDISHQSMVETTLQDLAGIYPEIADTIKSTVYKWVLGLPHAMQAGDLDNKHYAINNVTRGMHLVKNLRIESSTLDELLTSSLRDTVVALMSGPDVTKTGQLPLVQLLADGSKEAASMTSEQLGPVLLRHESQRRVKSCFMALIESVAQSGQQSLLAAAMLDYTRESSGESQIAAYWVCFEIVKAAQQENVEDDAFLDLSAFEDHSGSLDGVSNDLYTFSAHVLDAHTDLAPTDWRMEAIALEVISHAAKRLGPSFRPELIDVLFPVATFLGSESTDLQHYAVGTINSLASACDYESVSELIIDNVDYMVNSVALRLNSLDVSPASTKVLTMMIRLAGPRIIPFLDDIVESIFMALENYHAYPMFVENLFAVLKEAVKQGAQSDALLLEGQKQPKPSHTKELQSTDGLESLIDYIDKRHAQRKRTDTENAEDHQPQSHPKAPWTERENEDKEDEIEVGTERDEEKNPNSPTYQLLTRIATLTQYYLTSPVPELRRTLLEILTTASSALAADEDSFLPLVNAVWPVVIARLHDEESYVVVEACEALCHLCETAGDFLSTRIKSEWSQGLGSWCRRTKQSATRRTTYTSSGGDGLELGKGKTGIKIPIRSADGIQEKSQLVESSKTSIGGLGQHSAHKKVWEAVVKLLTAIISFVQVNEDIFESILDLLTDAMEGDVEVRSALESINADAVWLARYERGLIGKVPTPKVEGIVFREM